MVLASIIMLLLFFLPIWNITLEAPQYPTPLGMNIYINRLADENPNDLQNINLMNHYVGMKNIPDHLKEFDLFPYVVAFMAFLGLILGLFAKPKWFIFWVILLIVLGILGLYDFYLWEYDYGHNLSPHAAIKFTNSDGSPMAYQPPLFGTKEILNFTAHSYPRTGAFILLISMVLATSSFFIGIKKSRKIQLT